MVVTFNSAEEIAGAMRAALASGAVSPVLPVAATKNVGTDRILEVLSACPSPADRGGYKVFKGASGTDEVTVECDAKAPAALFVFKTIYDQFSGRVNLVRVLSGPLDW